MAKISASPHGALWSTVGLEYGFIYFLHIKVVWIKTVQRV